MLIRSILGHDTFDSLPEAVRRVHGGQPGIWRGVATIERGSGLLSRLCGFFARLPKADPAVATTVEIFVSANGEQWRRQFGASLMPSTLRPHQGLLREQLGAVRFDFLLNPESNGFRWRVKKVAVLGMPLPAVWFNGVHAHSYADDQGYAFEVSASLPIVGFIVRYAGHLK
jgi:hypothetical protein